MRPFLLALSPLFAVVLLSLSATQGAAQRLPRQLEEIKIFGKGESVEFVFSQPYQGTPAQEHKSGRFTLNFSGTGSAKPVRTLRPKAESLFQEVKIVQNRYSTSVSFVMRDNKAHLENRLAFDPQAKTLRMQVDAPASPAAPSPQLKQSQEMLAGEMKQRIAGAPEPATAPAGASRPGSDGSLTFGGMSGSQFFISLATMVIALVVIVGGLYGLLFLYNRFFANRLRSLTGNQAIKQLASFHIGPRQRIVVLNINGEIVACGVTPGQISYLTHLGGKRAGVRKQPSGEAGKAQADEPESSGEVDAKAALAGMQAGQSDSVHHFAQVLKNKVRSLKRIN